MKKRYSKALFEEIKEGILTASNPVDSGYKLIALWEDQWSQDLITKVTFFVKGLESASKVANSDTNYINKKLKEMNKSMEEREKHRENMNSIDELDHLTPELYKKHDEHADYYSAITDDLKDEAFYLILHLLVLKNNSNNRVLVL